MPEPRFFSEKQLGDFVAALDAAAKFANALVEETALWKSMDQVELEQVNAALRAPRPLNPFKSVLLPNRELIARYGETAQEDPLAQIAQRTVALLGVRGCECRALRYLDAVMYDEPAADPFYQRRRENTTVVSVDCAEPCSSCFCDILGERAYPEELFDLNLSPIEGGYVVEAGSEKGSGLLERNQNLFSAATEEHLQERKQMRERAAELLRQQNSRYSVPEEVKEKLPQTIEDLFWRHELGLCVQCGGCTAVCPTCYCFLLYDRQAGPASFERMRAWDSCQFSGYTVMAGPPGGAKPDPRRSHMSKFQHRFAHKFWYDPVNWGVFGCVGCGRCGETCPGLIDIRRVLSEVKSERVEHV